MMLMLSYNNKEKYMLRVSGDPRLIGQVPGYHIWDARALHYVMLTEDGTAIYDKNEEKQMLGRAKEEHNKYISFVNQTQELPF